ncbi:maleylpyruvate isomerase N-terminal domain-containing protein [Mycolicibacterium sp. 120270]|uniref:maleylpyruvate isomerase N-terminal domain-containing protein n=1 Tax=Mycolicibacterium sp. 120270 TaxID=3090600 RepID=UPI00299DA4E4|nr:maleylpyruvate isomerase N-terminal domain-containing protein [Mycolicibacterium sp. 120270]MDX1887219.1 maleylpyruvate isomerase N-terminal domain-containing protein [Mycolicibacterium sp. 120270]
MASPATAFESAARSFADLVRRIPGDAWGGPGLGEWDLRALVGHASRSLVTVIDYLQTSAEREDMPTPQSYYVQIADYASNAGAEAIVERGRQAGRDLGADPVRAVDDLVERAVAALATAGEPLIEVIGGLGIRLHTYLPTRTFELAVHSLDIGRATGLAVDLPADVLESAAVLAAAIGVEMGRGDTLLLSLTGREPLPPGFSVV